MLSSQAGAADGRLSCCDSAETDEFGAPAHAPSCPYAWKQAFIDRIWSPDGPKGMLARAVLVQLVWQADADGRCSMSLRTIAEKSGASNASAIRGALTVLVSSGWLRSDEQRTPAPWNEPHGWVVISTR
jgi:hypothetical protein